MIYLSAGTAIILGFIRVKLMPHALHKNTLPFINNGDYVEVPEISTVMSIGVIVVVLFVTRSRAFRCAPVTRAHGVD